MKYSLLFFVLILAGCMGNNQQDSNSEIDYSSFSPDSAIERGAVVITNTGEFNTEKLKEFEAMVDKNKSTKIEIVEVTTEGSPIYKKLSYKNKQLKLTIDSTSDSYGENGKVSYSCKRLVTAKNDNVIDYKLSECKGHTKNILITSISNN
ncbi:DUF4362 domain-containing protein [Pontibacillus litoralis]|uniref:DUF4362 domain-containing protein n=1 Tax=Pontibacillus litoralis JSM 072002 TaxID=1385512 RepID=A0A0A5FVT6_9BACI|nr:DUF4362 domain-containing protein [Pontibacillus litoralis]KGX84911.1 hypothetical protein N784_11600 [Pontibacillus litoralis JSM 072002]